MTITELTIDPTFKFITLKAATGTQKTLKVLYVYIGSDYLSENPIDLSSKLSPPATTLDTTITLTDLGLDPTGTLQGIYTIYLEDSTTVPLTIEQGVANLYYVNLCLANMIVLNNAANGFNEISTIYFLIQALNLNLDANIIEEALNCYERILAMIEKNPKYLVTEDITPAETGSGDWIIDGTYVIN